MNALQESNEYNKIPEKNQSVNSLNYSYEKSSHSAIRKLEAEISENTKNNESNQNNESISRSKEISNNQSSGITHLLNVNGVSIENVNNQNSTELEESENIIERLKKEYEEKLLKKDEEIKNLKIENVKLKDEIVTLKNKLEDYKTNIQSSLMNSSYFDFSNEDNSILSAQSAEYINNLEITKILDMKKAKSEIINKQLELFKQKNPRIFKKSHFDIIKDKEIIEKINIKLGKDGKKKFLEKYDIPENISNKEILEALRKYSYNQEEAAIFLKNSKKE